ncbi:MAG: AAA family ATPase, partial [Gammaproteobacteria bacterium]|nr:AAA family ATPase [Gammaproteobacteria bacterium]
MSESEEFRPLPDRMRPHNLADFSGQSHLLGEGKPLRTAIETGRLHSMVFWGPPGTGKTTLAKIIAESCEAKFLTLSAVLSGVKDIREAIEQAKQYRQVYNKDTVLFVDEVHRFNKSQQDAFLPYVEELAADLQEIQTDDEDHYKKLLPNIVVKIELLFKMLNSFKS